MSLSCVADIIITTTIISYYVGNTSMLAVPVNVYQVTVLTIAVNVCEFCHCAYYLLDIAAT